MLLASQYNIDAQKARIIQARLWENPYLSGEMNVINPQNNKTFDIGDSGQKAFAIQQLIYLGHKKKYQVELAKSNATLAELEYQDLLRNIRFQLRKSFFSVYYDNITINVLSFQLQNLDTLVEAYNTQADKGNVPLKEVVRLQSLFLKIRNNYTELFNNIVDEQKILSIITGIDSLINPLPVVEEYTKYDVAKDINTDSLFLMALKNRPDIIYTDENIAAAQWNLKWQKSLVTPDLTLGSSYDQRGGAFNNQLNLTFGIPLVLWNRNQGNIKLADANLKIAGTYKEQKILELKSEIKTVFQKYLDATRNYQSTNATMQQNFEAVNKGVFDNFQKRNITLIEFTDFVESYNESINEINRIKKIRTLVFEEINFITAGNIF